MRRQRAKTALVGIGALLLGLSACQSSTAATMQGRTVAGPEPSAMDRATSSEVVRVAQEDARSTAGPVEVTRPGRAYVTQNEVHSEMAPTAAISSQARASTGAATMQ